MTSYRYLIFPIAALLACGGKSSAGQEDLPGEKRKGFEPPVVTNAETPVAYPPELYRRKVEGTVVLKLYLTADGRVVPESTAVTESSGNAELDKAALAAVDSMHFAPALKDGQPVATSFLQPVQFRHPDSRSSGGEAQ